METRKPQVASPIPPRQPAPRRRSSGLITGSRPGLLDRFNTRQNRVLIASIILLLALILFPPWIHERTIGKNQEVVFAGWQFLFMPPDGTGTVQLSDTRIDFMMMGVEVLGLIALSVGCIRSMADPR